MKGDEDEIVQLRVENRLMRRALGLIQEKGPSRFEGGGHWAAGVADECFRQLSTIRVGKPSPGSDE